MALSMPLTARARQRAEEETGERRKKPQQIRKGAPHYAPLTRLLMGGTGVPETRAQAGMERVLCHPVHSMLAISSSQSGINVQPTPQKIHNMSNNDNNLQALELRYVKYESKAQLHFSLGELTSMTRGGIK